MSEKDEAPSSSSQQQRATSSRARLAEAEVDANLADWYGNMPLHHAVSRTPDRPNLDKVLRLLERNPSAASVPNQFGRLPLHYALDRCRADLDVVRVLLDVYPHGARVAALDNVTPYDLAMKWKHCKSFLLANHTFSFSQYY
jgi:ankyrin repeat protein